MRSTDSNSWHPASWQSRTATQQPSYEDPEALAKVVAELARLPPIVVSWEVENLRERLAAVQRGEGFLLQGGDCAESYISGKEEDDLLITRKHLIEKLERLDDEVFHQALIIRTLPNSSTKKKRRYASAPYFSNEAMAEIARRKVNHLLVDVPSVDRMDDQGKLSNHRLFWEVPSGSRDLGQARAPHRTITELIFALDEAHDGYYLLNLQIAPFSGDAAPSRPLIFPVEVS